MTPLIDKACTYNCITIVHNKRLIHGKKVKQLFVSFAVSLSQAKVNISEWVEPVNIKYDERLYVDDEELADIQGMYFYKVK